MGSSGKRTRGPNKQTPWARRPEDGTSVLRLALDTSDPVQRARQQLEPLVLRRGRLVEFLRVLGEVEAGVVVVFGSEVEDRHT